MRRVRLIEAAKRGFTSPGGLAYSPRADALVVFGADPLQGLPGAELRLISMSEDPRASIRLATAVTDPRNLAFDAKAGRLLLLDARRRELIAIPVRSDGTGSRAQAACSGRSGAEPQVLAVTRACDSRADAGGPCCADRPDEKRLRYGRGLPLDLGISLTDTRAVLRSTQHLHSLAL